MIYWKTSLKKKTNTRFWSFRILKNLLYCLKCTTTRNSNNELTMVKTFMNLRLHIKILKRHKGTKSKAKKTYLKFEYCKMISNKGLNNFDSNLQSYTQGLSYLWSNPNKSINRKNIPNPFALFPAFPKTPWFSFPIFCPYYLIMLILLYMAIIMILDFLLACVQWFLHVWFVV